MTTKKRISSKDVAKEAGVSQATVSYVLNNVQGIKIKPETREAVLLAAQKLNYHPNLIAKSMRLKKAMSIGIVSDKSISSFMFMNVLEGIKEALVSRNYSMTLCINKSAEIENSEHIKYYSSNRIDGIIFAYASPSEEHVNYLTENNIPYVVIHTNVKSEMNHLVKTKMFPAILEVVTDLKQKYGDEIAYFGTNAGNLCSPRYSGYLKSLESNGIELDYSKILKFASNDEGVEETLDKHIEEVGHMPRAVLCDSANLAFNVLKYAAQRGISIPDQTALVAIGTSNFSSYSNPSLSSIEAPLYNMGVIGCEMLFDVMDDKASKDVVVLEWKYEKRGSS